MTLFKPNSLILYVTNIKLSTQFYSQILQQEPIETFEDFSVFILHKTFTLGLQSKDAIEPAATKYVGGFEICVNDTSPIEVDNIYHQWCKLGIPILLEPTHLDFGYTFVALDPDGHRLRICATDTSNIK